MAVIYERWHSPYGCVRIHDDCLPRTEAERQARRREMQQTVQRVLGTMIDQHGAEGAEQLLKDSPYNPDNWTAEELARYEEVQRIRTAWWDWRIAQDIQDAKDAGRVPQDFEPEREPPAPWVPPVVIAYQGGEPPHREILPQD